MIDRGKIKDQSRIVESRALNDASFWGKLCTHYNHFFETFNDLRFSFHIYWPEMDIKKVIKYTLAAFINYIKM